MVEGEAVAGAAGCEGMNWADGPDAAASACCTSACLIGASAGGGAIFVLELDDACFGAANADPDQGFIDATWSMRRTFSGGSGSCCA